jgi:phosphatidylglycerophosphatase GEP4
VGIINSISCTLFSILVFKPCALAVPTLIFCCYERRTDDFATHTMVQSINTKAIMTLAAVFRRPGLLVPHVAVATCSDVSFDALAESAGIEAVVFDKDHTLTLPYDHLLHPSCREGLESARRVFGRSKIAILSNSAGTASDDPHGIDAEAIEKALNIPVIRHEEKKPGGIRETLSHFQLDDPSRICIIGDRILTDIVFGNLHGMLTIHTQILPTPPEMTQSTKAPSDNWTARLIRPIENKLLYGKLGRAYIYPQRRIPHAHWSGDERNDSLILPK